MKKVIKKILAGMGYSVVNTRKFNPHTDIISGNEKDFMELYTQCKPFTMTSIETMFCLYKAMDYILKNNLRGDFVECGVWKGGSSMMVALMLKRAGRQDTKIYLYDTFEGMPEPGKFDQDFNQEPARDEWERSRMGGQTSGWCYAPIEEVKANLMQTAYPEENIRFIKGKVEETLPGHLPADIALLRLDTDWYDSTLCELKYLYPLLVKDGVIVIDDYGHWKGCRKATDEFFSNVASPPLLSRIDYSTRIGIKIS